jgi:sialidase-1
MRAYHSGFRAISISPDGGMTWSKPVLDKNLPCPTCQASMIHATGSEILFLNPATSKEGKFLGSSRRNLTLRLSLDEGRTWSHSRVINQGAAGYSDLAITDKGGILCIFENGVKNYREKISIVEVNREWLVAN